MQTQGAHIQGGGGTADSETPKSTRFSFGVLSRIRCPSTLRVMWQVQLVKWKENNVCVGSETLRASLVCIAWAAFSSDFWDYGASNGVGT